MNGQIIDCAPQRARHGSGVDRISWSTKFVLWMKAGGPASARFCGTRSRVLPSGTRVAMHRHFPCTAALSGTSGCQHTSSPSGCDDGNVGMADACVADSTCSHTSAEGACDDGDACTIGETCALGLCGGGTIGFCHPAGDRLAKIPSSWARRCVQTLAMHRPLV